ncbi:MAG: flap endonuclease-1 [Nitrosarchaeum sp.]|nr:flap endonuclease-1 [Nitrosarchaeum sp.]
MGTHITELIPSKPIKIEDLQGKTLAIDAHNMLYQFLTTIRQRDGTPLTDAQGNITSHLIGLFSRTCAFLEKGLRPVFIFDGEPPERKRKEIERRTQLKHEAALKLKEAISAENLDQMAKYAGRTSKLTRAMAQEAKELLHALGIPCIQAPGEGEAQAAEMVRRGEAYAVVSQDADSLLFGAPRIIKNLNLAGKRKQAGTHIYHAITPELITLTDTLNALGIDRNQLIALAMLVGTDYHPGGIKGLGPKKALKLVLEHGSDLHALFSAVNWEHETQTDYKEIHQLFTHPATTEDPIPPRTAINPEAITALLVQQHAFSQERVASAVDRLIKQGRQAQRGLADFLHTHNS